MNDYLEREFKKAIADYEYYMATVGSWEFKKTIEERLEKHAKIAKRFLGLSK